MIATWMLFFLALQTGGDPHLQAVHILQRAIAAEQNATAVAYTVLGDYPDDAGKTYKGHTDVLVEKSPYHFRAQHEGEDGSNSQFAVSDGKTTHASDGGTPDTYDTFLTDSSGPMIVDDDAATDVAAVWRLFLNSGYLQAAISSGKVLYLWQGDVEGDRCNIIIYAHDTSTDYFWFSDKSGLPRAFQRVDMYYGRARLFDRRIISNIRLNPDIPADAFVFHATAPTPAPPGASKAPAPKTEATSTAAQAALPHLEGQPLPNLEIRDPQYRAQSLSHFTGMPTLISFWAPWCGPCQEELAALEKLQPRFQGKFQVVALAVQDQHLRAIQFIEAHPQYKFQFFTDPDMEIESSRLESFFGIVGIPVSVFADAQGKIVAEWNGFDGEADLVKRLTKLVGQPKN